MEIQRGGGPKGDNFQGGTGGLLSLFSGAPSKIDKQAISYVTSKG